MDGEPGKKSALEKGGHFIAAVTGSQNSEYLIRWTDSVTKRLNSTWTALHISDSNTADNSENLQKNLSLARNLGADVIAIADVDVASSIVRIARIKEATALVIGKSSEGNMPFIGRRSIMEDILKESGDLDIIILQGKTPVRKKRNRISIERKKGALRGIFSAAAMLLGVTLLGLIGQPVLGYRSISILYLLCIITLPFFCGRLVVFLGAGVSIVLWNLLFIPPKLTFSIASLEDILMFFAFFLTAFVGGYLTSRLKDKETALSLRERRIAVLYGFTRDISRLQGLEEIAYFSVNYLQRQLKLRSAILLKTHEPDKFKPIMPDGETGILTDSGFSKALAVRCFNTNDPITDGEDRIYLPLGSQKTKAGVLYVFGENRRVAKGENRELLIALAGNAALTMEREILSAENERNKMANETARQSKILLNLVSHELRTPLTTIKGSVSGLLEGNTAEDPGLRETLLLETMIAANKLNIIVEDLLVMSRLESGRLRFHPEPTYLGELIGAAKETLGIDLSDRNIILEGVAEDSDIEVDAALMVQVFRNILRNFAAYTPARCRLAISIASDMDFSVIHFSDNGPGISEQELPFVFDTFFRGSTSTYKQGCGLGLAICRGIIEAHGGMITAENITEGGLRIIIRLPRRGKE